MLLDYSSKIAVPSETLVAEVTAWPDEVQVTIHAIEGNLTVAQARELAELLITAADNAPHLAFTDDENPTLMDDRVPAV